VLNYAILIRLTNAVKAHRQPASLEEIERDFKGHELVLGCRIFYDPYSIDIVVLGIADAGTVVAALGILNRRALRVVAARLIERRGKWKTNFLGLLTSLRLYLHVA
jgi:hypothetical protein